MLSTFFSHLTQKHSTVPATRKTINSIPAETRTHRKIGYCQIVREVLTILYASLTNGLTFMLVLFVQNSKTYWDNSLEVHVMNDTTVTILYA